MNEIKDLIIGLEGTKKALHIVPRHYQKVADTIINNTIQVLTAVDEAGDEAPEKQKCWVDHSVAIATPKEFCKVCLAIDSFNKAIDIATPIITKKIMRIKELEKDLKLAIAIGEQFKNKEK